MEGLSSVENGILGVTTALLEGVLLQPTLYWKNMRQQGLPLPHPHLEPLNPHDRPTPSHAIHHTAARLAPGPSDQFQSLEPHAFSPWVPSKRHARKSAQVVRIKLEEAARPFVPVSAVEAASERAASECAFHTCRRRCWRPSADGMPSLLSLSEAEDESSSSEAEEARPRLREFNPQNLANTAWAFATAGQPAPELFSAIGEEARPHLREFKPQELSNTVWAYATAGVAAPEAEDVDIDVVETDLRIDVFRASGPGGQSVNTTDSAVRITHEPSGIVASCQTERSQHQNRENAMKQLRAKLFEMEMLKRSAEKQAMEDSKSDIGWGSQIRSYVLDQSRIKDLRTNFETGNTSAVLDGNIDEFMRASLKAGI